MPRAKSKYTTIWVTQDQIDRAVRKRSSRCVVATAVADSIEGARRISVDLQTIRFTVGDERRVYLTPPAAVGYVVAFDRGDDIHPFGFRLSENYRVNVQQQKKTEAGKARMRSRVAARKARGHVEKAEERVATANDRAERVVAKRELAVAEKKAEEAEAVQAEVMAAHQGEKWETTSDGEPHRRAVPQAFKRGTREYGMRRLAINQAADSPEERAARAAVTAAYDVYDEPEHTS